MPFADPEKRRTYQREYQRKVYERDREKLLQRGRDWSTRNREYARLKTASYRLWKSGKITREQHEAILREPKGKGPARNVHGLTQADYDAMLERQAGVCALCGRVNETGIRLHVDHEHVPGYDKLSLEGKAATVRGLLCIPCNMFLGLCQDDPEVVFARATSIAERVRSYLKR